MTRGRKTLLALGVTALLLGGGFAIAPRIVGDSRADVQVVSIKSSADYQNPLLLAKAWELPVAKRYRSEIEFQHNGSLCGPTSLANVTGSLNKRVDQEIILQGTGLTTVMGYLPQGITLDQLANIARRKISPRVTVLRDLDLAAFREHLQHANDPERRYVINFSREPLFGTGGGHHSPIAGYLASEDLVLVLDVNQKYGPWLVKSDRLYEAMNTLDSTAKQKRGMLLIEP